MQLTTVSAENASNSSLHIEKDDPTWWHEIITEILSQTTRPPGTADRTPVNLDFTGLLCMSQLWVLWGNWTGSACQGHPEWASVQTTETYKCQSIQSLYQGQLPLNRMIVYADNDYHPTTPTSYLHVIIWDMWCIIFCSYSIIVSLVTADILMWY